MTEKLKAAYLWIDQRFPAVGNLLRRMYHHRSLVNTIQKQISGQGNRIVYGDSIFSSVIFDIKGNDNLVRIADRCILNNVHFYIRGNHHQIHISAGCRFNRGGSLYFEDHNGCLTIGEDTTFEDVHIALTEPGSKVTIGRDCMFAYDLDIRTGDSHSIIDKTTGARINFAGDINIGNHVWVAAHTVILKGVSIADDCVVATASVVVNSLEEPGVIVAGNPAKTIRRNITWSRKRLDKPVSGGRDGLAAGEPGSAGAGTGSPEGFSA
jgi:acetyltransferase-like isoleucine patch superfamily enzyme